jgi:hypothetical protein
VLTVANGTQVVCTTYRFSNGVCRQVTRTRWIPATQLVTGAGELAGGAALATSGTVKASPAAHSTGAANLPMSVIPMVPPSMT